MARAVWKSKAEEVKGVLHVFEVFAENQHHQVVAKGKLTFLIYINF